MCNHCRNLKVSHQGKRKKHDHIVVSSKTKFNIIEVLTSKTLCDSPINHGKFVSANNVLRKCNEMKEEIKNPKNAVEYTLQKNTANRSFSVRRTKQTRLMLLSNCVIHGMKKSKNQEATIIHKIFKTNSFFDAK